MRIWHTVRNRLPLLLAAFVLAAVGCPSSSKNPEDQNPSGDGTVKDLGTAPIRVNAGGGAFVDSLGQAWLADTNYNLGTPYSVSTPIAGTVDDPIYQSERFDWAGGLEMIYSFVLDPGPYIIRLHFAEIYAGNGAPGKRVFDVAIENVLVLQDFDATALVGYATATIQEFNVNLADGILDIEFLHGLIENPKISGIEIIAGVITNPVLDASPSTLDFGSVSVGGSSAAQTVTLSNTGDAALVVSSVALQGANAADFASTAAASYSIDPGSSAQFDVSFQPLSSGAKSAQLAIVSNDAASPALIPLSGNGLSSQADVTPVAAGFGSVFIGESSGNTLVTITNNGNQTLNVSSVSFGGTNPGDFTSTAAASYTIAPSGSESFNVSFVPSADGARSADLVVTSDAPSSPDLVSLSGQGVTPQPPTANASPVAIDFGTITVSTMSGGQSVNIVNDGDQTLVISGIALTGSHPSDFATNAAPGYSIAPSDSVSFDVTFTPTAEGARSAQVNIVSNDPASPAVVLLSGQGQQPQPPTAVLSPPTNDFGTVKIPNSSSALAVILSNTGDDMLEVSSVALTGAHPGDFNTDAFSSYSIPVGQSVGFSITFTPTASGVRTASLAITSNDPAGPALLNVSGTGEDPLPPTVQLSAPSLSFGTVTLPNSSAPQLLTIDNVGEETLEISSVSITGTHAADFSTDAAAAYSIDPGGSASFNVTFTPQADGARTATVVIDSNDPNSPAQTALSGTGDEPPKASVSPTSHDFGQIALTEVSGTQAFTVQNTDTQAHSLTSVSVSGVNPGEFVLSGVPSLPLNLSASATATADIAFAPTVAGASTADLIFEFDGGAFSVVSNISGTGVDSVPTAFYRLNSGGGAYTDPQGNSWVSDSPYVNTGNTWATGSAIAGTELDPLFQSERWDSAGGVEMQYSLPVDPGDYTVRLYFAEIYSGAASTGKRVFDVVVEGQLMLDNFDIFNAAGFLTATIQETTVTVSDGTLNIEFQHVTENPKISAVEVLGQVAGVPVLSASPLSVDFGQLDVGVTSSPTQITLTNIGATTLQINNVQITNETACCFSTDAAPPYSLAPSDTVSFNVTLTPQDAGARTASLEISSNDLSSPKTIALSGEGIDSSAPQFSVSPTSAAFGNVDLGLSSSSTTITFTNDDSVSHEVSAIDITGANTADFLITSTPSLPVTVPGGGSITADVAFAPTATGARSGELSFHIDNDAFIEVSALSGTGQDPPPPPPPTGDAIYRINAGGTAYTDTLGNAWSADNSYNTGSTYSVTAGISGTADDPLYQSERWDAEGGSELMYSLPIGPGTYEVRLHFAEIYSGAATVGGRVFDVVIEGLLEIDNYDAFAAVGFEAADVVSIPVTVTDGTLNIELIHQTQNPKISAIEVLSSGGLEADGSLFEWGHVGISATGDVKNVTLTNIGEADVTISTLAFNVNSGVGHDFHVTLDGTTYIGSHMDIVLNANVTLAPAASTVVAMQFLPTEELDDDIDLVFGGNFSPVTVRLIGTGGEESGHPFLHAIIIADPYIVDFDGDGSEPINLVGSFSHTHEIGHSLTAFEWSEGGTIFSTAADLTTTFPVGDHTVTMTIFDDNTPAEILSATETFSVVAPNAIPDGMALYFAAGGAGGANAFLDAVPSNAGYAETLPSGLQIVEQSGAVGGSPYSSFVMVQMLATVQIDTAGSYYFIASGGNETRLLLNGSPHTAATALTPGNYNLDARFAIDTTAELPIAVTYAIDGGAQMPIDPLLLTHDESTMTPVINSMPTSGLQIGGGTINIQGLGFIPTNQAVVHWGAQNFSGGSLTVTPTQITLTAPSGTGTVQVTVETPNGVSNAINYTYSASGPAPVQFDISVLTAGLTNVTAGTLGPDGRLYVGAIDGTIYALTMDENYTVTDTQTITTIAGLTNPNILGLTTSPFDPPGVVKLYVSHSLLFANGGSCFNGFSPYSGQISVLTGPNFNTADPIITQLPVSNHDHAVNGIQFDDNGDLLIAVGGNTNAGILACNIGGLDESPLSGAVLRAKLSNPYFNGQIQYIDPVTCLPNNDQVFGGSVRVDHGVDISVFGAGLRNALDLVYTTWGDVYATDNGPNVGFGDISTGPTTQIPFTQNFDDELNLVDVGRYYGSANRNRGQTDYRQNIFHDPSVATISGDYEAPIMTLQSSTNGIIEYRSETFNGAMRGELLAQKWNGKTYRVAISADGESVTNNSTLFTTFSVLDIVLAPGGVVLGIDYSSNMVLKALPDDIGVAGVTAYEIFPWRAPASGGHTFTIGGENFGTLGNTTVTIGGVQATLTSVTSKRIQGTIPAGTASPQLLDVVVSSGAESATIPKTFRYLRTPGASSGSAANITISPGGTISTSSTYTPGSFKLKNNSTNGQKITRFRIDIHTALIPDSVFDPFGLAGDPAGKDFTQDGCCVGLLGHQFFSSHDGGYDTVEVTFDDFSPGETAFFSVDNDPTSIRGAAAPGPNHSGSISGLDLSGSHVRVEFDDGTVLEGNLFRSPGSVTASEVNLASPDLPTAYIEAVGVCSPAVLTDTSQTITVYGPAGFGVRLILVESALYLSGVPGGGFDIDPFEHNTALSVVEYTATIGGSGSVNIPVTLKKSNADAGYNVFQAVLVDVQGDTGPTSQTLVLQLN